MRSRNFVNLRCNENQLAWNAFFPNESESAKLFVTRKTIQMLCLAVVFFCIGRLFTCVDAFLSFEKVVTKLSSLFWVSLTMKKFFYANSYFRL